MKLIYKNWQFFPLYCGKNENWNNDVDILVRPPHNVHADLFIYLFIFFTFIPQWNGKINNQYMSSDTNHVLLTMHMCGFGLSGFRCLFAAFFLANPSKSVGAGERVVGVGSAE